mmetsp:Transcript_25091/g.79518  ORF Transcript_25091/g.79518 Transcript_25091/m.79518 type:complete len:147 (-) Transcript_25091:47-487(-)
MQGGVCSGGRRFHHRRLTYHIGVDATLLDANEGPRWVAELMATVGCALGPHLQRWVAATARRREGQKAYRAGGKFRNKVARAKYEKRGVVPWVDKSDYLGGGKFIPGETVVVVDDCPSELDSESTCVDDGGGSDVENLESFGEDLN